MRRFWVRLGVVAVVAVSAWLAWKWLDGLNARGELLLARQEISQGRLEPARRRLAALAGARPGAMGGQVDYLLGVCESSLGRVDAALAAFGRLPAGYHFDPRGASLEAEANLQSGRLRAAEQRLETALGQGGPGLNELRRLLSRVYEIQLRIDDSLTLYRDSIPEANEPFALLQRISSLEGGTLPLESLRATLDEASRISPEDDRVWLGQARLAMQMGQWDQAETWLRRCLAKHADTPVWQAWLEWARGTGQAGEVLEAIRALSLGPLTQSQFEEIRAWLCRQAGEPVQERAALTALLEQEPRSIPTLERLAALAPEAVQASAFRSRKAEIDHALDRYRLKVRLGKASDFQTATSRFEIGKLAESAGLLLDARDWFRLALATEPAMREAAEALSRVDASLVLADRRPPGSPDLKILEDIAAQVVMKGRNRSGQGQHGGDRTAAQVSPSSISFTDEAEAAGLKFVYLNGESKIHQIPETTGGGVGLIDNDGDGRLDVYLVQGGPFPPVAGRSSTGDRLFRNKGDGTFEDVTARAGLGSLGRTYGHGVAVADYDNDGRPDLFLTRWRTYILMRNRGDGTFEDVTATAGLGGDRDWPTSAAFADLDGDGDLDLYVCHYGAWDADNPRLCRNEDDGAYISCNPLDLNPSPDHLFRNDSGKFIDVTDSAGISDRDGRGLGVVSADLDGDGRIDLYVANDLTANYLWKNLGGWKFEEVGHAAGVAGNASGGYQASMGIAAGDLDGDGRIDLAVTNFYGECTTYYHNLGNGAFTDSTTLIGLDTATRRLLGFGVAFLDVNNDGLLDLASANGHVNDLRPHFPFMMPAQLLLGVPGGRLVDISARAGPAWSIPRMGRGLAAGDVDNDGRVDVLLLGHNQPLAYLHNRSEVGHFLTLKLEGERGKSNRDGLGCRVTVRSGGRSLVGWKTGGGSYQSASDHRLHFGLGDSSQVESIEVAWPSGHVDRHRDPPVDRGYLIKENATVLQPLRGFRARGTTAIGTH